MPYSVVRFNLHPARSRARSDWEALPGVRGDGGYADEHDLQAISLEEHHGAENGWSPSPLVMAGLVFGRTQKIMAAISALLVPLHDPLRIAEDIAVLDLASGGRLIVTGGIGYRESEYAAHGRTGRSAARCRTRRSTRCSRPGPASRSSSAGRRCR